MACKTVKGKLEKVGKWPWQVNILFLGVYICGGSFIDQRWVLTAAHCLQRSKDPQKYSVSVGAQHLSENSTLLLVSRIVIHENFSNLISHDIALLKLKKAVSWSPLIQPVCLPSPKLQPSIRTMCWVIGWGPENNTVTPNHLYGLQEVAVRIINNDICKQRYKFLLLKPKEFAGQDILCASSEEGMDSCQVNSGSSLVCQVNNTWVQMGVVSWSFSCPQSAFPGIYTSTSYFTRWIKKQIGGLGFISRAGSSFLCPVFLTGYILLVSLGFLWLL